jgi:hypothetical protein
VPITLDSQIAEYPIAVPISSSWGSDGWQTEFMEIKAASQDAAFQGANYWNGFFLGNFLHFKRHLLRGRIIFLELHHLHGILFKQVIRNLRYDR